MGSQKGFNPNGCCCVARQLGASDLVGNYAKKERKINKTERKEKRRGLRKTENKKCMKRKKKKLVVKIFGLNPTKTFYMTKRAVSKFVTNEKLFPTLKLCCSSKRRLLYNCTLFFLLLSSFVVCASFHAMVCIHFIVSL